MEQTGRDRAGQREGEAGKNAAHAGYSSVFTGAADADMMRGRTSHPGDGQPRRNPPEESMETIDIGVDALRDWLESGRPVTVLDIRPAAQREEWSIPGSLHVDAQTAMRGASPSAIAGVPLTPGQPVVAVCAEGRTSVLAVRALKERGVDALSLKGGMRAWSLAWNRAEVIPLPGAKAEITQIRRTGKGCLSYIVGSKGEAAVVDASVDPEIYLRIAEERGFRITHVIDTHVHADHLSRSRLLAARCRAQIVLPDQKRVSYPFKPLREGDSITIGAAAIVALATPGHTSESMSYLVDGRALLTGDTLFPGAVGRPDLAASAEEARKRAHALYATLQRIMQLSPDILILPCHTSEPIPFDGILCGARLDDVIRQVDILRASEDRFVETLLSRIPVTPPNHLEIVRLNESGEFPAGDPTALEAGANRCAIS
jgi:glyoxylase-like metal-dependent hydrolase (beta-lactamase superfamily II)/rhodanese-related sulfurtransferase